MQAIFLTTISKNTLSVPLTVRRGGLPVSLNSTQGYFFLGG
jgi:hypothetical protein